MVSSYNAEILWVDLTERRIEVKNLGEEVMRKYIGGAGLAAKILWDVQRLYKAYKQTLRDCIRIFFQE